VLAVDEGHVREADEQRLRFPRRFHPEGERRCLAARRVRIGDDLEALRGKQRLQVVVVRPAHCDPPPERQFAQRARSVQGEGLPAIGRDELAHRAIAARQAGCEQHDSGRRQLSH
jgi:hypothetical protein